MNFGEKLKTRRKVLGLTQDQVAKEIGISRRSYNMYEQRDVFPRYEKTLEKLAKVLDCDVDYLKRDDKTFYSGGMTAAIDMLSTALGAAVPVAAGGAITTFAKSWSELVKNLSSKEELSHSNDFFLQYSRKQKKFQTLAMGLILERLADINVMFTRGDFSKLNEIDSRPDQFLMLDSSRVKSWWFSFWTRDEKLDEEIIVFPSDRAAVLIGRYATISEDPYRKVSIVVDDEELYQELIKFKNHNSFNGNMSIMLIDTNKVVIVKEQYIAIHKESKEVSGFLITEERGD